VGQSVEVLTADRTDGGQAHGDGAPATATEQAFAEVLAEVMRVERVPVDGHFFQDLGADSMVMAQFCARVRKRQNLPSVSMKDIYQHSTIRALASSFGAAAPAPAASGRAAWGQAAPAASAASAVTSASASGNPLEGAFASVLAELLQVEQVPVDGHFFQELGADSMVMAQFCARLRKRQDLPSVSMKDIYQHSTIRALATAFAPAAQTTAAQTTAAQATAAPATAAPAPVAPGHPAQAASATNGPLEGALAGVLAELMRVEQVPVDGHFFDDMGADSMVMAQFCARLRKRQDLPSVSMKDIYRHSTIRDLATAFAPAPAPADVQQLEVSAGSSAAALGQISPAPVTAQVVDSHASPASESPVEMIQPIGRFQYFLCGFLQLLIFLGYCYTTGLGASYGYDWITTAPSAFDIYLRSVIFGGAMFLAVGIAPIIAKWILIGRWKPREIRIWSLGYVRFWLVKTMVRFNPLALMFTGTPLYSMYLRALGAKIGKGAVIFSHNVPVCSDLFTLGAGSMIRKDAFFPCYRAHAGRIQIGPVTLGREVFIGEKTVLDIHTSMGDGAQLGHASVLHTGQAVPAGEHWHGCPGQPTDVNYLRVAPARCSWWRKATFSISAVLQMFLVIVPLVEGGLFMAVKAVPALSKLQALDTTALTSGQIFLDAMWLSLTLFFGLLVAGLVMVSTLPRLLNLFIKPGKVYPLYGFHYGVHRTIARMTNLKFFMYLFGDSSYIVHYLRGVGYKLSTIVQTGSNFGMELAHDNPFLSSVGTGTMVADGLSFMNADYSSTSFSVSQVSLGQNNFIGNNIAYPAGGRTGDNVLLATKVMIPLDGEIRQGVGLLGSPCFEIPRSVDRDSKVDDHRTPEELRRSLRRKNRYDARTMGVYLVARWLHLFLVTALGLAAIDLYGLYDYLLMSGFLALNVIVTAIYFVLVERCFTGFRPLKAQYCSINEPYFWWHERLWKAPSDTYLKAFDGTPFKSLVWRALGVRIGKRVFDDGCYLTERTLVTIGDDCTLNQWTKVQCHSQEDGAFKSAPTVIGAGVTLGIGAMVHYGVTVGEGAVIGADSFLMKGEEVPPYAYWEGNPAREIHAGLWEPDEDEFSFEVQAAQPRELEMRHQQALEEQHRQALESRRRYELELQHAREFELQQQRELQLRQQRELEARNAAEMQFQADMNRKWELALQHQAELQHRERRQRELELQMQREWELQLQREAEARYQLEMQHKWEQALHHQWELRSQAELRRRTALRERAEVRRQAELQRRAPLATPETRELPIGPGNWIEPAAMNGETDLAARLARLNADIRALEEDGERAMTAIAQYEDFLATIRPTIDQLAENRRSTEDLIREGTTNGAR
jgi:non-ribosomal peptide synthetase-like protein